MGKDTEIREAGPELFRALIECTRDIHTILDGEGTIVYQSPSLSTLLGWTPKQMLGAEWQRYAHPDEVARLGQQLGELLDGTSTIVRTRFQMLAKDGGWVHLESIVRNELANPAIRGILIVSRDVTSEVEAERALREREHLLRTVEGHPCLVLWALDKDGVITVSEGAGLSKLGLEAGEIVGQSVFEAYAESTTVLEYVKRALNGETLDYTVSIPTNEGPLMVDNRLRPQISDSGEIIGVTAITFDVTEREQLESELRRAKTMEAIGMLAGGIAHDFNNLLTAIGGFATAAKRADAGDRDRYLDQVIEAGQRGGEIVGQLLSFARKDESVPESVSVAEVLEKSLPLYRQILGDAILIQLDISNSSDCIVEVDRSKLEQVFLNLVVNARDAMPDGGSLTIRLSHVDTPDTHRCVQIEVEDNGIGMAPDTVACAFEPFYSTKQRGTGLGLATTHSIVARADGMIAAKSTLGTGTTFQLRFPCSSTAPPREPQEPVELPKVGSGRILLIDDNVAVLKSTALTLEFFGYEVRIAESGQEGYDILIENQSDVDLVITDMTMPGMKGDELAERIRMIDKSIPIICVSGHHEPSSILDKLDGISRVSKPYLGDDLSDVVAHLLTKQE